MALWLESRCSAQLMVLSSTMSLFSITVSSGIQRQRQIHN
uniref:Uncharacterized protein n=1 Tax=Anguilla anguilla TaxID=7936 RepID=A0A0E9QCX2_ANGAN